MSLKLWSARIYGR